MSAVDFSGMSRGERLAYADTALCAARVAARDGDTVGARHLARLAELASFGVYARATGRRRERAAYIRRNALALLT